MQMSKTAIKIQDQIKKPLSIQVEDLIKILGPCGRGLTPSTELVITTDSRTIKIDSAFFCYVGTGFDPHSLLVPELLENTGALICEKKPNFDTGDLAVWVVRDARQAWAKCCMQALGNPQKDMEHWGITGTNGKTSVSQMISQLLAQLHAPHLVQGTLGSELKTNTSNWSFKTQHTTPDPDYLAPTLVAAKDAGCKRNIMEVASQSILHRKLTGIKFKVLAFTSFSQDHLDLHGSMEKYFETKMNFFIRHAECDASIFVHASVYEKFMVAFEHHKKPTQFVAAYGLKQDLDKLNQSYNHSFELTRTDETAVCIKQIDEKTCTWQLNIQDNVHFDPLSLANLCCALAIIKQTGSLPKTSEHVLNAGKVGVRGRFEQVLSGDKIHPHVFVDYAHTPDALAKVLQSGRQFLESSSTIKNKDVPGKLWVVFGCGGDRDRSKRRLMGKAAEKFSDFVVVTSDNPRTENPDAILTDIMPGLTDGQPESIGNQSIHKEAAREKAILYALENAAPCDCVIIAGKGHETTQIIGDQVIAFDDAEKVRQWAASCET